MTMTSSRPHQPTPDTPAALSVIEQTYPRWQIRQRPNNMWIARRITPPTPIQAAAGLHRYIIQPSLEALAAVLCQQLLIAQTSRAA